MRNRLVGRGSAQGASPPAPLRMERGVVCEVTHTGLLKIGEYIGVTRWSLPSPFGEGLGVRPLLAVRFCEIGWLNVSVETCVFCSSVFSVRKRTHPLDEIRPMRLAGESFLSQRTFLSLTELTDLTEPFCAQFRAHRRPSAYRIHRTLQLKKGVGWWLLGVDD